MLLMFEVYILNPIRHYLKWRKVRQLKYEFDMYKWAHGTRVPDGFSKVYDRLTKETKIKLDQVLTQGELKEPK